ncbi:hypothetical protein JB92DRAFT_894157 [Gautieria morchelliformis]|nr:hypothetical protein JB92DRAFT_894157 [Gautieria morchelliformis]
MSKLPRSVVTQMHCVIFPSCQNPCIGMPCKTRCPLGHGEGMAIPHPYQSPIPECPSVRLPVCNLTHGQPQPLHRNRHHDKFCPPSHRHHNRSPVYEPQYPDLNCTSYSFSRAQLTSL